MWPLICICIYDKPNFNRPKKPLKPSSLGHVQRNEHAQPWGHSSVPNPA